jgi:hypothetical protein
VYQDMRGAPLHPQPSPALALLTLSSKYNSTQGCLQGLTTFSDMGISVLSKVTKQAG